MRGGLAQLGDNLPIPVEAITQSITEMEPCIRDTALQYFLAEVKKTDGNDYPSASLYQLFVALQGQIRLSDPSVNLLTQPTYVKCRKVLDSVMKRSAEGLGAASRRRAEPISSLEENILWERAVIGSDNPPKLLDTMVYLNGIHFVLRGGHRSNAVRSYKRTANFQQNESSEILYGKKQKTTTCTETKLQSEEEKTSHDTSHQVVNIESVRRESVAEPTTLSFTFNIKLFKYFIITPKNKRITTLGRFYGCRCSTRPARVYKSDHFAFSNSTVSAFPNSPTAMKYKNAFNMFSKARSILRCYSKAKVERNIDCDFLEPAFHGYAKGRDVRKSFVYLQAS
ncbi:unnamed protein product [Mytilus coruscus]|uniref:ZMYM2-like/QRICH1 C-terminal domain-containing protein n=1 Tax=Mytilus coruscus TaxID=42192 RepID=A0A6J8BGK0_MYTCO|nr:unnamed protein product [Mytilus coruscus]